MCQPTLLFPRFIQLVLLIFLHSSFVRLPYLSLYRLAYSCPILPRLCEFIHTPSLCTCLLSFPIYFFVRCHSFLAYYPLIHFVRLSASYELRTHTHASVVTLSRANSTSQSNIHPLFISFVHPVPNDSLFVPFRCRFINLSPCLFASLARQPLFSSALSPPAFPLHISLRISPNLQRQRDDVTQDILEGLIRVDSTKPVYRARRGTVSNVHCRFEHCLANWSNFGILSFPLITCSIGIV